MAHDYLTIGQLIRLINQLKQQGQVTDETIVILSADSEGNSFGVPAKNAEYSHGLDVVLEDEKTGTIYSDTFTLYPLYEHLEPIYGYEEEED
jgi:hypothetical protein